MRETCEGVMWVNHVRGCVWVKNKKVCGRNIRRCVWVNHVGGYDEG